MTGAPPNSLAHSRCMADLTMLAAGVFAVLLTPMLSTAYYNTSASLVADGDLGLRSQREIAGKVAAGSRNRPEIVAIFMGSAA